MISIVYTKQRIMMIKAQDLIPEFRKRIENQKYSYNTVKNYINCVTLFLEAFKKIELKKIREDQIEKYIQRLVKTQNISQSYQKQILSSIHKFFLIMLNREIDLSNLYPDRKDYQLPKYLSKEEVKSMIEASGNIKHKCIICLLYSGGLRLQELVNLKLEDIDSKNNQINILESKGTIDRKVMLSSVLSENLKKYYQDYLPKKYLFEGKAGQQYSGRSVQMVVKKVAKICELQKEVSPHILRHSFAIHLLENGTDIRYIQQLLGHNSIKTTEIYRHIIDTKIRSPLDY